MQPDIVITIGESGTARMIYADAIAPLLMGGASTVRRASHVEPAAGGGWAADLSPVGGPVLGPFPLRQAALDAEVAWLRAHVL
jgi:hypothetical protein